MCWAHCVCALNSATRSKGALKVHAAARGLPPPAPPPPRAGDSPAAALRSEGATFLLEMVFTGPGFDGRGAVFAEGQAGEGKGDDACAGAAAG